MNLRESLEARIAELASELDAARSILSALDSHPSLLASIVNDKASETMLVSTKALVADSAHKLGAITQCAEVMEFLASRDNAWTSIREIMDGTGLGRGPVSSILYASNKDKFDVRPAPGSARNKQFRQRVS